VVVRLLTVIQGNDENCFFDRSHYRFVDGACPTRAGNQREDDYQLLHVVERMVITEPEAPQLLPPL
jgi:hypothetical protein